MNDKKIIVVAVVCALVFGGSGYYLGTKKSSLSERSVFTVGADGQFSGRQGGARSGRVLGGNFTGGEIISINEQSISVKSQDGGSKIVFYSTNTPIMKMASGTVSELEVGKNITVSGKANPDGSVTAESIQLRPTQTFRQATPTQ